MENPEEVLQSLDEFAKLKPKDIPRELEEYLSYVAKTGDPVYQWSLVKCLFREKMLNVITDFYESCPSMDLPPCPNVDPFNYETLKTHLLERLDSFANAPFTVQRLCELLTTPRKEYTRVDKFMRAIEKNILVVSTKEPGSSRRSNDTAQPEFLMNGVMEGRGLDIGEAIETVSSDGVNLMHDTSVTDPVLADSIRVECEEMDMEEAAAADVAVAAAAAAVAAATWDKPVAECEIKADPPTAEVKHSPCEDDSSTTTSSTTSSVPEFTPEVFGRSVQLGAALSNSSPVRITLSGSPETTEQPPQQPALEDPQIETKTESLLEQEQVAAVCSITEEPQEEEEDLPVTPVIQESVSVLSEDEPAEIQPQKPQAPAILQSEASEPKLKLLQTIQLPPSVSEPETDKEKPKDTEASTSNVELDMKPVITTIAGSDSGGCGDTADHISSPLEANISEETTVDIPSGILKSESLLKSLEEFADNLSGLDGTSTPPFSELNTDEDTQDAVRGSDQLDDDESMDVKEEEEGEEAKPKPSASTESVESIEETKMEVDPHEEEEDEEEEEEVVEKEDIVPEESSEKSAEEEVTEEVVDEAQEQKAVTEPMSEPLTSESPGESEKAQPPPAQAPPAQPPPAQPPPAQAPPAQAPPAPKEEEKADTS